MKMNVAQIAAAVGGTLVTTAMPEAGADFGYASDLLSDVMGHVGEGAVLITIQNHLNTIAVCTLAGISVIVICHARPIPDDMLAAANREHVAIVTTPLSQFACSVALAALPPSVRS